VVGAPERGAAGVAVSAPEGDVPEMAAAAVSKWPGGCHRWGKRAAPRSGRRARRQWRRARQR